MNYKGYTTSRPAEFEDDWRHKWRVASTRYAMEKEYKESRIPELTARAERGEPLFDD